MVWLVYKILKQRNNQSHERRATRVLNVKPIRMQHEIIDKKVSSMMVQRNLRFSRLLLILGF